MMDLPGIMSRGNWTAALFVDDKALDPGGEGPDAHLHRPRRRHHASALDPGRPVPRRAPGADQLRDAGRDPHRQHREIRRRRHHAGARQGAGRERRHPQQRILDRARRHRRRAPTSRASAASAATGTWPAARPRSSSSIGAISKCRRFARVRAFAVHVFTAMRRGAGVARADLGDRRALGGDVLLPRAGADRRRPRRAAGARLQCGGGAAALVGRRRSIWSSISSLTCSCRPTRSPPAACCRTRWRSPPASSSASPARFISPTASMKTADNYFRGFPALWNLAAFYLYLLAAAALARSGRRVRARRADLRADPVRASAARGRTCVRSILRW